MQQKKQNISDDEALLNEERPRLDKEWFDRADGYVGTKLVSRGRPKSDDPKQPVSIRLDRDVLEHFKNAGPGWQTRINDELRKVAGL